MWLKILCFLFIVCLSSNNPYAQRNKKFFRKDYKYIEATQSFYKIHTIHRTWSDAKRTCALEGASFFYPENYDEAQAIITFWNATQPFRWVFIGISDLVAKGVFETVEEQTKILNANTAKITLNRTYSESKPVLMGYVPRMLAALSR